MGDISTVVVVDGVYDAGENGTLCHSCTEENHGFGQFLLVDVNVRIFGIIA